MNVEVLNIIGNIYFYVFEVNSGQNFTKKPPKMAFSDPNFGHASDKNAIKSIFLSIFEGSL